MEMRTLGRTGESLSVIGFGATVFNGESPQFAREAVARAIDAGINYFDMGPSYGKGEAEDKGGPAIAPYRDRIFLAEKTGCRTKDEAAAELRQSLKRMQTDHFDLYQFHGVSSMQDVETIVGPGGALEAFVEAKERGLVRFLGVSAHNDEAALALMDHYDFDSILCPVNYVCWHQGNFGPAMLEAAQAKGMGVLALKTLAKQPWPDREQRKWAKTWYAPVDSYAEALAALRWTLSRGVTACVCPSHAEFLWWMLDAEKEMQPLTAEDEKAIRESAADLTPIFTSQIGHAAPSA